MTHTGGLVVAHRTAKYRLVWVDRSGVANPAMADTREFLLALEPDGTPPVDRSEQGP